MIEPPTKIWCPPREKPLPIEADDSAPVRIYTPPHPV